MVSAEMEDEAEDDEEDSRSSSPASTYDDPAMYDPGATPSGSSGLYGRPSIAAAAIGDYKTRTRGALSQLLCVSLFSSILEYLLINLINLVIHSIIYISPPSLCRSFSHLHAGNDCNVRVPAAWVRSAPPHCHIGTDAEPRGAVSYRHAPQEPSGGAEALLCSREPRLS